ncbi:hypothetical protein ACS0PU_001062 [Formica fusca]
MPGREQEGGLRPTGLRGRLGRVQPLVSLLLHVALGQTEQSLPAVPAGVVYPTNGEVILTAGSRVHDYPTVIGCRRHREIAHSVSVLDSFRYFKSLRRDFGNDI